MKKILTTLAVTGLTAAAFGQGLVNWSGVAGLVIVQTNSTVYSSLTGGAATGSGTVGNTAGSGTSVYYYELLVSSTATTAPTTAANLSSWLDTGLEAENSTAANGKIIQLNSGQSDVANNLAAGATVNTVLVGWSSNLGSSWATVENELANWSADGIANAYFGTSIVGSYTGVASPGPGNPIFGAVNSGLIANPSSSPMQIDLLQVPEPGTMALAALGGASMLLFCRKK